MNFNNEALRIYNVLDFFLLYNWFADEISKLIIFANVDINSRIGREFCID